MSPSSRRAWIEISRHPGTLYADRVALLAEGVDRNNRYVMQGIVQGKVALLAEGVDRNFAAFGLIPLGVMSPSSRRAWIEMIPSRKPLRFGCVALLAEGVDRNRCWNLVCITPTIVALLAEGVDRNCVE